MLQEDLCSKPNVKKAKHQNLSDVLQAIRGHEVKGTTMDDFDQDLDNKQKEEEKQNGFYRTQNDGCETKRNSK